MIKFNRKDQTFEIIVHGDEQEYFNMMRALSRLIANQDEQTLTKDSVYYVSTLLEEMLPGESQQVKIHLE